MSVKKPKISAGDKFKRKERGNSTFPGETDCAGNNVVV
jgi:hypothetical protein